jgi:hypothetical protein
LDTAPQPLGALGLAIGSSIAAWFEYFLLRKRIGKTIKIETRSFRMCKFFLLPGFISAIVAGSISFLLFDYNAFFVAPLALFSGGVIYTFGASILGSKAAKEFLQTISIM